MSAGQPIYLDYNSTTPVLEHVLERMLPYFARDFGNASSATHAMGWRARSAVDAAREEVAGLIGAMPDEIVFTSGATESINLALKGTFEAYRGSRNQIVTFATEHAAVLDTCKQLEARGAHVTVLPVLADGTVDLEVVRNAITKDTLLVAAMMANNETGVVHPVRKISELAHELGALFFSDTTQVPGKLQMDVADDGLDLCCLSAHKFYGPKGVGALYVRRKNPRVNLIATTAGGGHENGRRSGTLNVPGIVGMGAAAEFAQRDWWEDVQRISVLRTTLEQGVLDLGGVSVNGNTRFRLPNTTNLCFIGHSSATMIRDLHPLCVAIGSACSSESLSPSHVLTAMGIAPDKANSSIRFSLGKQSTEAEVAMTIGLIRSALGK